MEQLIRAGHLKKFPEVGKNEVCEACDNAGVLVECYSCNIVWHRGCIPTHQARPETSHLLESPDADWVCGTCLDEARAAHQKQMQQPLVHAIGPRQVVRSSSEMAEIGIVSALTGAKHRYLCSLRATPRAIAAAHHKMAPRAAEGTTVNWEPLAQGCRQPLQASVGDTTLQQLGVVAGSTTTVRSELRGSGSGSGDGSGDGSDEDSDDNTLVHSGKKRARKLLDDSSSSDSSCNDDNSNNARRGARGGRQPRLRHMRRGRGEGGAGGRGGRRKRDSSLDHNIDSAAGHQAAKRRA